MFIISFFIYIYYLLVFIYSIYLCYLFYQYKTGSLIKVSAVTCLSQLGVNSSYLISGGADGILNIIDLRYLSSNTSTSTTGNAGCGSGIVEKFGQHRNGVHSLLVVDENCVFSGDGAGILHCHSLSNSMTSTLVYGLGASRIGAVKTINMLNNNQRNATSNNNSTGNNRGYIMTGADDGKAIIWEY